ncbi:Actin cytoskeleton-regulatory complex protein [Actinidia chinensis var. chinensis]|uniref:Actin cytoskeleton-regulatory complex protein n=1 Tax=Actinidia chinensis var. chinensis TaxID=1590841 RepID=A0A2R6RAW9_ACTCC|nr:Actin cytoskeleton-regulatory complex protein [Actinidia chinensis var. chinensis]
MTSHHHHHHHPSDLDSAASDSLTSSPRSDAHLSIGDETAPQPRVRFMCSFGGKILPRPHDNQLRYVGGDTRIVAVQRHGTTFASLLHKLGKLAGITNISIKYQLPNEDLDALITVTTDEDVENMMDEYDRFHQNMSHPKASSRLRLFLFTHDSVSRTSSISSLLGGSTRREHWFLDALNGGSGLERWRSEVSSIMSEVPDYLFGLDSSDDQARDLKSKTQPGVSETVSSSDPGSPAPVVSSPFCSTSSSLAPVSMPSIPELPPIKTKPNPSPVVDPKEARVETFMETSEPPVIQQSGYAGNPMWHYAPGLTMKPVPVYYMPGTGRIENAPPQPVQIKVPYVQVQSFPAPPGQIQAGYHPIFPGMGQVIGGRPVGPVNPYAMLARVVTDDMNQPVYYGMGNAYPGMVGPGGDDPQLSGPEAKEGRVYPS